MSLFRLGLLATLTTTPLFASADIAGLYAGGGVWQSNPAGTLGNTSISLDNSLNFDEENSNYLFIALEHPIPLLPNLRLSRTDLEWAGQGTVPAGTSLDEVVFPIDQAVAADLDLSHTEITFYYEVLDNIVDLDLGLTARIFDGEASLIGASQQERVELDAVIPMLYGKAGIDLPFTGLSAAVSGNWINVNDFHLIDWSAELNYDFSIAPTLEAGLSIGYRSMLIEIDDQDELQSDAEFDGLFVGLRLIL
ncbi:TIGR04219 family outer membrane beta-barrel protein [SAR92 clade bacterium H455]|uniref:TIGR04219 family outer membrane beta-barrel protein n=1 Tax=SAR92 clade bacterium H455 TaxID=2974818 RepID=A0ABY5TTW8_9GAMM|nr:TIGR04219 family outer membrane beta-barrel protein [SAR92 clade bacterium H455]